MVRIRSWIGSTAMMMERSLPVIWAGMAKALNMLVSMIREALGTAAVPTERPTAVRTTHWKLTSIPARLAAKRK